MSEALRINDMRVQGQGIPWTTWGIITPHAVKSIKDPDYFSKAHNLVFTGDFVEVLSQDKATGGQVLLKFYVEFADPSKAIVNVHLTDEIVLVKGVKKKGVKKKGAKEGEE